MFRKNQKSIDKIKNVLTNIITITKKGENSMEEENMEENMEENTIEEEDLEKRFSYEETILIEEISNFCIKENPDPEKKERLKKAKADGKFLCGGYDGFTSGLLTPKEIYEQLEKGAKELNGRDVSVSGMNAYNTLFGGEPYNLPKMLHEKGVGIYVICDTGDFFKEEEDEQN